MALADVHGIACYLWLCHNPAVDLDLPALYPSGVERVAQSVFRAKEHVVIGYSRWGENMFRRQEAPFFVAIFHSQCQQRVAVGAHAITFGIHAAADTDPPTCGD